MMTSIEQYNQELYHYGVKGMKWGVRRNIGIKSRAAAQYRRFADDANRNVKRLEAKKSSKGLTDRQVARLKYNRKLARDFTKERNSLIKNMSEKDIKRGERAVIGRYLAFGGVAGSVVNGMDLARANKVLERERNR